MKLAPFLVVRIGLTVFLRQFTSAGFFNTGALSVPLSRIFHHPSGSSRSSLRALALSPHRQCFCAFGHRVSDRAPVTA